MLGTLAEEQKDLLGIKLSEFPSLASKHLREQIRKIRTDNPCSMPPNAVLADLVTCALLGCAALMFSLW